MVILHEFTVGAHVEEAASGVITARAETTPVRKIAGKRREIIRNKD